MSAFVEDFEIDGVVGASGEFSGLFANNCLKDCEIIVNQSYRARTFLKFVNEVYKRHKDDYGKKSPVDLRMKFVNHPKVGAMLVIEIGDKKYGLCPTTKDTFDAPV